MSAADRPISRKQAALMDHLVDGKSVQEAAEIMGMARSTADTHLARVKYKLRARSTEQAVVFYDRQKRDIW